MVLALAHDQRIGIVSALGSTRGACAQPPAGIAVVGGPRSVGAPEPLERLPEVRREREGVLRPHATTAFGPEPGRWRPHLQQRRPRRASRSRMWPLHRQTARMSSRASPSIVDPKHPPDVGGGRERRCRDGTSTVALTLPALAIGRGVLVRAELALAGGQLPTTDAQCRLLGGSDCRGSLEPSSPLSPDLALDRVDWAFGRPAARRRVPRFSLIQGGEGPGRPTINLSCSSGWPLRSRTPGTWVASRASAGACDGAAVAPPAIAVRPNQHCRSGSSRRLLLPRCGTPARRDPATLALALFVRSERNETPALLWDTETERCPSVRSLAIACDRD